MSSTRRAHRKSRSGCLECKRRRIKCGEEKPTCNHCKRYGKECEYITAAAHSSHSPPAGHSPPLSDLATLSKTSSPVSNSILPTSTSSSRLPTSLFELKDLALLHHWSLVTSVSILKTEMLDYIWQTLLPQVAFRHDYVMHSILSLTALHIAYLDPSRTSSNLLDAAYHHSKALDGFKADIEHISPENCDALFVNSILTFLYAFLMFGKVSDDYMDDADNATRTSRILGDDWIPLVRGVEVVLGPAYDHIRHGPLHPILELGNWYKLCLDASTDPYDTEIVQIQEVWNQVADAGIYDETLDILRRCRMWIAQFESLQDNDTQDLGYNRAWSAPFIWLFLAPHRYFELLRQRQPPALLLFAWFGATIHSLNEYWWMEGCGARIVDEVAECLSPEGSSWMVLPSRIVKSNGQNHFTMKG